ncbi:MAG: DUF4157 domain-containing protein [Rhodanobacter sp.]|nr:MAG: DUF4157 domain-containing protein [Rhodanobacter sp.]
MQGERLAQLRAASARQDPNGLPQQLRAGIEALSGMDMGDVVVHRNSARPAQLNALAYAQGSQIHLGPGQEKHLAHEAWHVVQQRNGRVNPTAQLAGVAINDDAGLEREADVMGARALRTPLGGGNQGSSSVGSDGGRTSVTGSAGAGAPFQLATEIKYTQDVINYWSGGLHSGTMTVGRIADALLDPADPKTGSRTGPAPHPSVYTNGNWPTLYQGHLLNANLGGQAIPANLFPVTPAFNSQHSSIIEDNVKAEFLDLNAKRNNPFHAANYVNRRLHYRVEVINGYAGKFKPTDIGGTVFRCTKEYTDNNVTALGGTGADHNLSHDQLDIQVPPPPDTTLNERLDTLNWGPDNAPTYQLGIHPGGGAAPNVRTVLDGGGFTVPNMFINI